MRSLFTAIAVCAAAWMATGCALRAGHQTAASAPQARDDQAPDSLQAYMEKVRLLSSRPVPKSSAPPRVEQQDPELAARLIELSMHPAGEGHRKVAERYRVLGIPDLAYRHFNRALAFNPRDAAAYEGLARVWRDWGLPHLALGDAYRAVYYAPSTAAAHNTLGTVFQALGQNEAAEKAYQRAANLSPTAAYAQSNLCYVRFLRGDLSSAVETCRSALTLDPTFMAARHNLALAYAANGNLDLARAEFMTVGDDALAQFNMGIVYMARRDYGKAADAFNAASRANPEMNVARDRALQARHLKHVVTRAEIGDQK